MAHAISRQSISLAIFGALGVIFLVLGCVLIHVFDDLIHKEVKDNIPLKEGSKSFKMWSDPSSPIYFQVWMFDIPNSEEVLNGEKPILFQMGPYTYREKRHKFEITFSQNGTVSYRERISYIFEPGMSAGSENDTFVTVSLPMLTIFYMLQRELDFPKEVISLIMKITDEKLFVRLSVHDLMWGYHDNFLAAFNTILRDFGVNITVPEIFGLFYNKNNTDDGLFEIYSGLKGLDNFGHIATWNEQSELHFWTTNITNMINGTDGTIYPPFVNTKDTKYLFSSDLCRSLGLVYTETVNVKGIDLYKFVAPDIMFANASVNHDNAGFCTPPGNCLPSGLLNVNICRDGAPVIMSMPHFLACDEETIDAVIGLQPSREEHQSYIDIEPITGVVMNVGKKLQINTHLTKIDGFHLTDKLRTLFLPIMWLNESAMISNKDAADFKSDVMGKIKLTKGIQYALIAIGLGIIALVILILVKSKIYPKQVVEAPRSVTENDEPLLIPANQSS